MINIFLDDLREPPNDGTPWVVCRTAEACIELLEILNTLYDLPGDRCHIDRISLDHDLGTEQTGYDVALWIENDCIWRDRCMAKHLLCHSANPVGRARIERAFESVRKYVK